MPSLGTCVAIIKSGQILLTKRRDFEVWCLPGGAVDGGESVAQAAIREVFEETGLKVELSRLVGIYSRLQGWENGSHTVLFAAKPLTDQFKCQADEVIEIRYFHPTEIPKDLFWGHAQRIQDVLSNVGGSVAWKQNISWPFEEDMTRQQVYALCKQSNLTKSEFFHEHFGQSDRDNDELEVGDL